MSRLFLSKNYINLKFKRAKKNSPIVGKDSKNSKNHHSYLFFVESSFLQMCMYIHKCKL